MKTYSKEFIKELESRVFWEGSPYHDPRFLLSYNRIFIGDMSGRGIGKSTSWKAVLLLHWMRKQDGINPAGKFIVIRRLDSECRLLFDADGYWKDLREFMPELELKGKYSKDGMSELSCDGEVCGYVIPVLATKKLRSASLSDVDIIMYDECIPEDNQYKGGRDDPMMEPRLCQSLYVTVARGINKRVRPEVKLILCGNINDYYNPFFVFFGIAGKIKSDTKVMRGKFWVYYKNPAEQIRSEIEESQMGDMLKATDYAIPALGGIGGQVEGSNIEKMPRGKYFCGLRFERKEYGVYEVEGDGYVITNDHDPKSLWNYALTTKDMRKGFPLANAKTRSWKIQLLYEAWARGMVYYDTESIKMMWVQYTNRRGYM